MGLYASDGTYNVTVVDGTTFTGIYASDGSINVVVAPGDSFVGLYHPCGAFYVTVTDGSSYAGSRAPDGSMNVIESADRASGAMCVTVVSGSLAGESGQTASLYWFLPLWRVEGEAEAPVTGDGGPGSLYWFLPTFKEA